MMKRRASVRGAVMATMVGATALMLGGCATVSQEPSGDVYRELDLQQSEIQRLNIALLAKSRTLEEQDRELARLAARPAEPARVVNVPVMTAAGDGLLPPNAKAGECYARVYIPPTYKTVEERVLLEEGGEDIEVVPAKYEWVEEEVVVREASTRIDVVPAKFETREEKVMVAQATTRVEQVPAIYEWVEEQVLVRPAHTQWKKGRGPIEQVDNGTGEIMCLIEVPAEYRVVKKKVLKSEATTRTIEVPAEFAMVTKKVLVAPASTKKIEIPEETKRVRVRKLVTPEQKRKTAFEPKYQTVTKQVADAQGGIGWRRILCETNLSGDILQQIQRALRAEGHDPGPIDGIIGTRTTAALKDYQVANGIAVGAITIETLARLGVDVTARAE